jgi:peroxiredoxin
VVLAISVDPVATSLELAGKTGIEFPLLSDPNLEAIDAYGVRHDGGGMGGVSIARPAVFVLDREGNVAWKDLTENWRVRVRPDQVLEQLKRLP